MQFLRRSLVGLFLLSMTLGLLAYAGNMFFEAVEARMNREARQRPAQERVLAVNSVAVSPETIAPTLTAFGEVRSRRTLEVRASVSGRVVALAEGFEDGATVRQGDLLARIDPKNAQSALDVARTDLEEAEFELRDAERNLVLARDDVAAARAQAALRLQAAERQRDLARRGVGTEAAVETAALAEASANQAVLSRRMAEASAESRVDQARNRVSRARVALADAERDLEDTEVRAAFTGTLADVSIVEGGLLTQNEQIAQLIDPEALEVSFRLSTTQYARLLDEQGKLIGAPVRVTLDVLGLDFEATGRITRVNAAVGEGQTGRQLFAGLEYHAGFRPGDFVTVHVKEPELHDVARLPATAVDAAQSVLVIGPDGRLEVAQVDLLRRQGDDVIIRAPDLEGARLVSERSPLLGPGIRVRDLSAGDAPQLAGGPGGNGGNGGGGMGAGADGGETISLSPERRAALIAAVEGNTRMPPEAKTRILGQLQQDKVSAAMVERIESRMGG